MDSMNQWPLEKASFIVQGDDSIKKWGKISHFSNLDLVRTSHKIFVTFVYSPCDDRSCKRSLDDPSRVQAALGKTLTRYAELAGRIAYPENDPPFIDLNNAGALLTFTPVNNLELSNVKSHNYSNDFMVKHFWQDDSPTRNEFLLVVDLFKLGDGAFVMNVGIEHRICDLNGVYFFVTDFISVLNNNDFLHRSDDLKVCERTEALKLDPSISTCNPVILDTYEICDTNPQIVQTKLVLEGLKTFPETVVTLHITSEQLKRMKFHITSVASFFPGIKAEEISLNDCLSAVIWKSRTKAYAQYFSPDETSTFQLACNARFRCSPPKNGYFGNVVILLPIKLTIREILSLSLLEIAHKVRERVKLVDSLYVEEILSLVEREGKSRVHWKSYMHPLDIIVTNWGNYLDWYKYCDLESSGMKMEKFVHVLKNYFTRVAVLPHEHDGLDVSLSLRRDCVEFFKRVEVMSYFEIP